jgi:hypothetical protein
MPKFSDSNYNTLETYFNILGFTSSGDDNSYVVGQNGVIIAKGGVYTPLYQLKDDGDMVAYKFIINSIDGNHFIFNYLGILSTHSNATELEVGKEMYFRKDAFFRDWLYNNRSDYGNYVNYNKEYIYFGKIYEKSNETNVYYIEFEGLKDWVIEALPQHNRTDNLVDFIDVAFDHVYHESYNMMKQMWSFFDPKEVKLEHLWYLADKFGIEIDTELDEDILRSWVDQLNYFIKRKGTYTAYYIIFKLLFSNTNNKLNIYERWLEWCHKRVWGDLTPVEYFNEHHILEYYGIHPSGGAGPYWYQNYNPATYPTHADHPPWQDGYDCLDPVWQCGDTVNFQEFVGIDSHNVIKLQEDDLISVENFSPSGDNVYLFTETRAEALSAGGFRHCVEFYVPTTGETTSAATSPSGSIAVWGINNDLDEALKNDTDGIWLLTDVFPGGLGMSLYDASTQTRVELASPGTLSYDLPYYALLEGDQDRVVARLFSHGRRTTSSTVASGSITWDNLKRNSIYALNYLPSDNDDDSIINIDIGAMKLSSELTDSIGPTGNWFLSPHYKVEVDLSTEPMESNAIISQYYANELIRYWEYTKPVSKYVNYHFLLSPIALIDNFSESYSLYDASLPAYCDTRFTGSYFLSAASSGAAGIGEDWGDVTYVHRQATSSTEWRVQHNLGQEDLIVQVYDENDEVVYMDNVVIEDNNIMVLTFDSAARGSAFIAGTKDWNVTWTQSTSSAIWNINHNMGSLGASGFGFDIFNLNRTDYLIPDTVKVEDSNNMTVTWSTTGAPASATGHIPIRDEDYIHYQTTPSTVWTINHNLQAAGFNVEVWSNDEYIYPESIVLTSLNTTTLTFAEPVDGYAMLIYFPREFALDDVFGALFDGGYWVVGDEDNDYFDPVLNNSLYSPQASGSVENGVLTEYSDMYTFDFNIPTGDAYTIKEIGLFSKENNIIFYTRCSELYKPEVVQLDVHYRILKE